jgi:MoaA/NifB/PqqE/SkfB family radical SAM enzyme
MTGGEPMMDNNTYKVFQYITDHPKKDLHLNVTSNMCPADKKLKEKYFNMARTYAWRRKWNT